MPSERCDASQPGRSTPAPKKISIATRNWRKGTLKGYAGIRRDEGQLARIAALRAAGAGSRGCKLTTPSIHVIGRRDVIVSRKDSLRLADRFADPLVLEHSGGHTIPGHHAVVEPIAGFLAGRSGN